MGSGCTAIAAGSRKEPGQDSAHNPRRAWKIQYSVFLILASRITPVIMYLAKVWEPSFDYLDKDNNKLILNQSECLRIGIDGRKCS